MLVKDSLKPEGYLRITLRFKDGREQEHFSDHNPVAISGAWPSSMLW